MTHQPLSTMFPRAPVSIGDTYRRRTGGLSFFLLTGVIAPHTISDATVLEYKYRYGTVSPLPPLQYPPPFHTAAST